MKASEVVSLRLLDTSMKDWEFKDLLTNLRQEKHVQEVVVLPSQLRRAKQLLAQSSIKIGTVVDYPLGSGTVAKKAFEAGRSFQEGADFLEVSVTSFTILEQPQLVQELEAALRGISLAWGEIRTRVAADQLTEIKKLALFPRMNELGWKWIILEEGTSFEDALHDTETFSFDGGDKLQLQVNLEEVTAAQIQTLVKRGASRIGIHRLGDLDFLSLASLNLERL